MEPIKFSQCNAIFAKNQPEYKPLCCFLADDGTLVSCWKLTFFERIKILLTGKFYLTILTFNQPLQPLKPTIDNPLIISEPVHTSEPVSLQKAS